MTFWIHTATGEHIKHKEVCSVEIVDKNWIPLSKASPKNV